jgi:tetratricopeptide (TPR) repeat protein
VLEAISEATEAVASDPASATAWGKLGAVLDAHSYFPEAARCYRHALQLAPDDFRWNYHLAITLDREAGDIEEVIELFARLVKAEPRYPPIHYRLGAALHRHGRYAEAREALERALELDPDMAIARRQLGQVLLALGETEPALAQLERAVTLNPGDGAAHSALAQAYTRLGQTDRARAAAAAARRSSTEVGIPDPVRSEVTSLGVSGFLAYKRGQAALKAGRLDEAIALFQIKDEVNPSASNYYLLGMSHRQAARFDEAVRYFEKAIAMSDHADSHWQLGELMIERGRTEAGLDQLRRAGAVGSDDAEVLHAVGASLARYGQLEDAIEAFAGASRLDPTSSSLGKSLPLRECGAIRRFLRPRTPSSRHRSGNGRSGRGSTPPLREGGRVGSRQPSPRTAGSAVTTTGVCVEPIRKDPK